MTQGRHRAERRHRPHATNLRLLWVSQFINTTGLMMLVPIMPFYVEQLGVSGTAQVQTWAGAAIAAPAVTLTVATPLWGRVGDRVGRKWMVVRALVGLAVAMLVMAAAAGPAVLLLGRLLQGALGGVVEAAAGFVGAAGPDGERGKSLGKSFSATAAGALTGPLVGGALLGASGLRAFMVAVAVVAGLLAVVCCWGLREEPRRPAAEGVEDSTTAASPDRLQVRRFVLLGTAGALAYLGTYGLIPVFAEHLSTSEQDPRSAGFWVGALHSVMWAGTLLGSVWWGRRNDRTDRPLESFVVAAALSAASITMLALPLPPLALVPLRVVQGLCFAALAQSLFLHVSRVIPGSGQSGRIGMMNSFLLVGQGVGPLLAGPLSVSMSASQAILLLGAACAVAALLAAAPSRHEARKQAQRARYTRASPDAPQPSAATRTRSSRTSHAA